ncbi:MAG: hypothetical protein H0U78_02900 [Rickettsiaceae bacterium]|nr:hypothetical protein [Rickettsiaceae bacterium]
MTKEIIAKIQKHNVGTIMDQIRKNLSSHVKPTVEGSWPPISPKVLSIRERGMPGK